MRRDVIKEKQHLNKREQSHRRKRPDERNAIWQSAPAWKGRSRSGIATTPVASEICDRGRSRSQPILIDAFKMERL